MLLRPLPHLFLLLLFSLLYTNGSAQNCENPTSTNGNYLHGNNVRAFYFASGSNFFDGSDAQFSVEDPLITSGQPIATIFAHGLWMGGYDPASNLSISVATYGLSSGDHDYYPGPLTEDGTVTNETCANFDQVWSVHRYQIETHQADFNDNGVIDDPIAAVVGWPALGNDQFEAINGFELPNSTSGFAEFQDLNANGIYEPLQGEWPRISQADIIPDQIIWSVFNTRGNSPNESGSPSSLSMEVQLTAWALACTDNPTLNNTTFASYRVINRGLEELHDFRVALWTDFDLGCYTDDYVGSAPQLNTFFAYNQDNDDDIACQGGIVGAGTNPPVQAISFLNQPLDYFNYYSNASSSPTPPPATTDPAGILEYYNYMNGLFRDGTPITTGGTGYNPSSTDVVNHAFPGDPNDLDAWSEVSANTPPADRRSIGTTSIPSLNPGQVVTLDVAYSYHREAGANHLENVTNMYAGVADIQALYDASFVGECSQQVTCEDDCIWSGDLNADGIANHEDLIANNFHSTETGPTRVGPYNWTPQSGDSWSGLQFNGNDKKHLDANGDGLALADDFEKTVQHYNRTRPDYVPVFEYPEGDDFTIIRSGGDGTTENLSAGESFFAQVKLVTDVPDLRAVAFTLTYDPQYFSQINALSSSSQPEIQFSHKDPAGAIDFATYIQDLTIDLEPSTLLLLQIKIAENFVEPFPSAETYIRFRNIRAYLTDGTAVDLGAHDVLFHISDLVNSTEEPEWAQAITLFPNPVGDQLQVNAENTTIESLQLFDSQGRMLSAFEHNPQQLDLRQLPAGMYYLRLFHEGDFVVRKFVKM